MPSNPTSPPPAPSALARLFNPLRVAAAAFFKHDIAVRRKKGAVHIVLEQRAPGKGKKAAKEATREELAQRKEQAELDLIRKELAELLDTMPETRRAMKHLVFVEQGLGKRGLRALHKTPLNVLQQALTQLEGLVTNWSPVGLASLRSKMAVAIIDREHMDPEAEADSYRTAAVLDHDAPSTALPVVSELGALDDASDDAALAAAYAALGSVAPSAVEMQGELGSSSAKQIARDAARPHSAMPDDIRLRELQN